VTVAQSPPPWDPPYVGRTLVVGRDGEAVPSGDGLNVRFMRYHPAGGAVTAHHWQAGQWPNVTAMLWDGENRRWVAGPRFRGFPLAVVGGRVWGLTPLPPGASRAPRSANLRGVLLRRAAEADRDGDAAEALPEAAHPQRPTAGRDVDAMLGFPGQFLSSLAVQRGFLIVVQMSVLWRKIGRKWEPWGPQYKALQARVSCAALAESAAMLSLEETSFTPEDDEGEYEIVWLRRRRWRGLSLGEDRGMDPRGLELSPDGNRLLVFWPWTSKWRVFDDRGAVTHEGASNAYPSWDATAEGILYGTEDGLFRRPLASASPEFVTDQVVFHHCDPSPLEFRPGLSELRS